MLRYAKCNCVKWRKVLSLLGFGYLEMITLLGVYYYIIYRVKVCGVAGNVVFIGGWGLGEGWEGGAEQNSSFAPRCAKSAPPQPWTLHLGTFFCSMRGRVLLGWEKPPTHNV